MNIMKVSKEHSPYSFLNIKACKYLTQYETFKILFVRKLNTYVHLTLHVLWESYSFPQLNAP